MNFFFFSTIKFLLCVDGGLWGFTSYGLTIQVCRWIHRQWFHVLEAQNGDYIESKKHLWDPIDWKDVKPNECERIDLFVYVKK